MHTTRARLGMSCLWTSHMHTTFTQRDIRRLNLCNRFEQFLLFQLGPCWFLLVPRVRACEVSDSLGQELHVLAYEKDKMREEKNPPYPFSS